MKKLLSLVGSFALITPITTAVVACDPIQGPKYNSNNTSIIGLDIDKSQAIDTSISDGKYGISNFYTIGDSLSDSHGLESTVKKSLGIDLKLSGSYSPAGSFTDDQTAAVYLAQSLNFAKKGSAIEQPNSLEVGIVNEFEHVGRNYAVGGAMAADASGTMGVVLNKVNILEQSRSLIAQHKIASNDLVYMEIGGNDLFAMVGTEEKLTSPSETYKIMSQAVKRIKETFYTLLNNGIKKIIWSEPPNVAEVPRYSSAGKEYKEFVSQTSLEFVSRIRKELKIIKNEFPNRIKEYSFFDNLKNLKDLFSKSVKGAVLDKAAHTLNLGDVSSIILEGKMNSDLLPGITTEDSKKYFFFDEVHPRSEAAHKEVAKIMEEYIKEWK